MRPLVALALTLAVPSVAFGQTAPSTPPTPRGTGSTTIAGAPAPPPQNGAPGSPVALSPVQVTNPGAACPPAAETLFSEGMSRMAQSDDAGAAVLFTRTLELCPSHPSARDMLHNAEQHLATRGTPPTGASATATTTAPAAPTAATPPAGTITVETTNGWSYAAPIPNYNLVYGPDPISFGARVNLVTGGTITGMLFGGFVPAIFPGFRGEHVGAGVLLGGALGMAGSLLASMNGVTQGQAIAVNLGTGIGLGLGFSVAMITTPQSAGTILGIAASGIALGTLGGALLAMQRPLSGSMSFVGSMAAWSTVLTSHICFGVGCTRGSPSTAVPIMGGAIAAGLVGGTVLGALTAPSVRISSDRMGWIDLSMSVGTLVVGGSASLFAASGGGADIAWGWGAIAGAGLGALFGVLITQNTDAFWHRARQEQLRQPTQTGDDNGAARPRASTRPPRRGGLPMDLHMSPGGGMGQSPYGLTFTGTF
jgi:hypothetical protein